MTKEKQIEEMHLEFERWDDTDTELSLSEWLYNAGYRKASDVAREIVDEFIEKVCDKYEIWTDADGREYHYMLNLMQETKAELKKKYTEGGK